MPIETFEFENRTTGWHLRETRFDAFNLLVGFSGVGKTQILLNLLAVRNAAVSDTRKVSNCCWSLSVRTDDGVYTWEATTSAVRASSATHAREPGTTDINVADEQSPEFTRERIALDGEVLVDRDATTFVFEGSRLPKLTRTDSAIGLLKEESVIAPLHRALSRILFSQPIELFGRVGVRLKPDLIERNKTVTLAELRDAIHVSLLERLYLLQQQFKPQFDALRTDYQEIFDIDDLAVDVRGQLDPDLSGEMSVFRDWLTIAIKEPGVPRWMLGNELSSGMLRTVFHLAELMLAPKGTVLIVDEFENSLGVNCLPAVTRRLLARPDLQFILTSHHPYVINNVETSHWKLVRRQGTQVEVLGRDQLPALDTGSAQDKFLLLINLPEFEEGIR